MDIRSLFRENTSDAYIFGQIMSNEYKIHHEDVYGKTVYDIGAHIGSFSYFCLMQGADKIFAFEPDEENFKILSKMISSFKERCELVQCGVWANVGKKEIATSGYYDNPGGNNLFFNKADYLALPDEKTVNLISFDDYVSDHEMPDIVKLDCEYSEYPILLGNERIFEVPLIVGEFHEIRLNEHGQPAVIPSHAQYGEHKEYTVNLLKEIFMKRNYNFSYHRIYHNLGIFRATKK